MSVCFTPGQEIGRSDLNIFLTNSVSGAASNAAEISFALYFVDTSSVSTGTEVLIGGATRTPVNPSTGEYYAALMIPPSATPGDYRIRWTFRELAGLPQQTVVQEFGVVDPSLAQPTESGGANLSTAEAAMVRSLRILIRDIAPDKHYRFRPPEQSGVVGQYNQVFGFIWEDYELIEFITRAIAYWNSFPPASNLTGIDQLYNQCPQWSTAILYQAIAHAAMALSWNWVADEFSYSIGGISMDIEKSSKYESLKQNAEQQFDKAVQAKKETSFVIRGLSQSRFGLGVRSAFGPALGRGVLSPRSFI